MKSRPRAAEIAVVVVIVGAAAGMVWEAVVRAQQDGQFDSAVALFGGGFLTLVFVPIFLGLGRTREETDDTADVDLGRRGRWIHYLGLGVGVGIGYSILRENMSGITASAIALGFLAIRGVYKVVSAKAERGGPPEPTM